MFSKSLFQTLDIIERYKSFFRKNLKNQSVNEFKRNYPNINYN